MIGIGIGIGIAGVQMRGAGGALPWYEQDTPLANSLVGYWKLDEASGSRADSVGSNTLTDNNTVGSATGKVYSLAADFEADNSEYLSRVAASATDLNPGTSDFWISAWVKLESEANNKTIISKGALADSLSLHQGYWIYVDSLRRVNIRFSDASAARLSLAGVAAPVPLATWSHVLLTFDRDGLMSAYVDNVLAGGTSISAQPGDVASDQNIAIGATSTGALFFDGLIEQVAFGKGHLPTSDDRANIYNGGAGRA